MAWIPMIPEDEAEGEQKEWYDRLRDPWGRCGRHHAHPQHQPAHYERALRTLSIGNDR